MLEKRRSSPSVTFSARAVQGGTARRRQPQPATLATIAAGRPRGQPRLANLAGNRGGQPRLETPEARPTGPRALAHSASRGSASRLNHRPPETSIDLGPRIRHTLGPSGCQRSVRSFRSRDREVGQNVTAASGVCHCPRNVQVVGPRRRAASTELYSPAFAPKERPAGLSKTLSGNYK